MEVRHAVRLTILAACLVAASALATPASHAASASDATPAAPKDAAPSTTSERDAELDLSAKPPHDPAVLTGVLPNGLTWYVRANEKPENRAELRLAVRVGSVQEEENERGLAHFVEHMGFNGTENFEAGELIEYLESIGARFGADSNAYTSYDETVYMLEIPTDKEGALEKGLLILADWAGRAKLETEEIDKERGVVLDELRRSKGAWKRIREKQDQLRFHGSRYADRLTIGLEEVIEGAPPEVLRGFYERWYRPDIMAVAVVGDVEPEAMAARIAEVFGTLPKADEPTEVPAWPVPPHEETLYSVEADPEVSSSQVSVTWKHPDAPPTRTVGDIRSSLIDSIAGYLLTLRLNERARSPDAPFLAAGAGVSDSVGALDIFTASARARDGEVPEAADALMEEVERARTHGFLEAELARVKTQVVAFSERALKESPETRSGARVGAIVRSFLSGETLTSDQYGHDTITALLPTISLPEVDAALRRLTGVPSRVVLVQVPEKDGLEPPSVASLKAAVEPEEAREIAAWVDDIADAELMEEPPKPGRVVKRKSIDSLGVEELLLSNGASVVLKPTDFRADQVLVSGFARGGGASAGEEGYLTVMRSDTLAAESGLAGFTLPQLQKLLAAEGAIANANASISAFVRWAGGSARPQDLETMLQLLHLRFSDPAFRPDALERVKEREVEWLRNQLNSPQGVYGRAVTEVATDDHWLYRPAEIEDVEALELKPLERAYRDAFDDASEWTFFLVGNLDLDEHVPLIERYLASLPTKSTKPRAGDASYRELDIRVDPDVTVRQVRKGIEDQGRTILMIPSGWNLDPDVELALGAATDLLEIRLREELREEKGETYGVGAGYRTYSPYPEYGRVDVSFTSSPDTRASMVADVVEALKVLRSTLPSEEDMTKLREMRLNSLDDAMQENGWWLGRLRTAWLLERDPEKILKERRRIEKLTPKDVRRAARRFMDPADIVEVTLVPEDWTPEAAGEPVADEPTADEAAEAATDEAAEAAATDEGEPIEEATASGT